MFKIPKARKTKRFGNFQNITKYSNNQNLKKKKDLN